MYFLCIFKLAEYKLKAFSVDVIYLNFSIHPKLTLANSLHMKNS